MYLPPVRNVGLNALYLVPGEVGGTEIYARELTLALAAHRPNVSYTLFLADEAYETYTAVDWPESVRLQRVRVQARRKALRAAVEMTVLPVLAARNRHELIHSLGTTSPLAGRSPRVVTIHDLIYDLFPGTMSPAATRGLRLLVPSGARRSNRVIADSAAAAKDISSRLKVPPTRVDVVHLGVGASPATTVTHESTLRARYELRQAPVILCVSAALPHKNLDRLIRALSDVRSGDAGLSPILVIIGHSGRVGGSLGALARSLGLGDRVRITGWVSHEDLEGFYRLAACFAYPSLYEGFGMPVLEAMRRGVPVVCSDAASLPEVAGGAAEYCSPESSEAIAQAVNRVINDPSRAEQLKMLGREQAHRFSWTRTAEGTFRSYEKALSGYEGACDVAGRR